MVITIIIIVTILIIITITITITTIIINDIDIIKYYFIFFKEILIHYLVGSNVVQFRDTISM